ncbi:MAG TPA: glycoside hydrolase family 13 protein [Fibrobacteraceae bacterium]|nr:glycoside hydrolase family 13 protein [Fibrobacteraceae bacterium]
MRRNTARQIKSTVPTWAEGAVFYQIFPDRFRRSRKTQITGRLEPWGSPPRSHTFTGGNLRGILEGLDHIAELGVNALYLCPIFASTANHRYHTNDYFRIDPLLGSETDFDALVTELHHRGMHILLDGVFNHCSRGLYQFNSLLECGADSPFRDWFLVDSFPLNAYGPGEPNYRCWWNLPALPKFNTDNPEVREFLWRVGEHWMQRGIDGWRLDVPNEIDDDVFWREFRCRIKAINPEAYIVGEIWEPPERWLQGDQFDGVMNYPARRVILEALFPEAMSRADNLSTGEPPALAGAANASGQETTRIFCERLQAIFPKDQFGIPFNLLGSHDNVRLATLGQDHPLRQSLAWAILFFLPGALCLYAGDEIGLEGGRDPDNRRCFPWEDLPNRKHLSIWNQLRELVDLRQRYACLRIGSFGCCPEGQGLLFWRELGKERLELRIGFPGPIGVEPSREVEWDELLAERTEPVSGMAGRIVQRNGWQIMRVKKGSE